MTLFQIVLVITKQSVKELVESGLQNCGLLQIIAALCNVSDKLRPFEEDTRDEGHCYGYDFPSNDNYLGNFGSSCVVSLFPHQP